MRDEDRPRVLVVDDAPDTLEILDRNLASRGYKMFTCSNVTEAVQLLEQVPIDLVITDLKMPEISGLDLVRHVRENLKNTRIMMITGYASVDSAVEALKLGAEEYLAKPFTDEELYRAVEASLNKLKARETVDLDVPQAVAYSKHGILGNSPAMQKVFRSIQKAAATSATVLIAGESGTGKELVARAIHYSSDRSSAPFVPVNCGGIPEGLLESELFGHVKGSFTGATASRAGFFQTADGGTIFLDEIAETSLSMQVKLLRVLQSKEVGMVGSDRSRKVDVRVLAASNKDLFSMMESGAIREDLYFRLSVLSISVPPLRERGDDILLLIHHFTEIYSNELGKPVPRFSDDSLRALKNYTWPGNVRELENVIQRLVVMTDGKMIDVPDLPSLMRFSALRENGLDRPLAEVEAEHIRNVLASVDGNKTRAAEILGIDRKTLRQKLKKYKLA